MKLWHREIGPEFPPFVVADLSASHLGSYGNAELLIHHASEAGADAIKLQTYRPKDFTTPNAPAIAAGPWKGARPWDLYQRCMTPWDWHPKLFEIARKSYGMVAFSSPFSPDAVAFLEELDCPAYKIAALETENAPLGHAIYATGKPVMISFGAGAGQRLARAGWGAMDALAPFAMRREHGERYPVVAMHSVTAYPSPVARANLQALGRHLNVPARGQIVYCSTGVIESSPGTWPLGGLSDHSPGSVAPMLAVALGACVIEKHLKLPDDFHGPDAAFAMTPDEFGQMVRDVRLAWEACRPNNVEDLEASQVALRRRWIGDQLLRASS